MTDNIDILLKLLDAERESGVSKLQSESIELQNLKIDDEFVVKMKNLNPGLDQEYLDTIMTENYKRLNQSMVETEEVENKNVLVYGKVQSGKTINSILMLDLLCKYDYDVIIFLGGNTKSLLSQNEGRFFDFKNFFYDSHFLRYRDISSEQDIRNLMASINRKKSDKYNDEPKAFIPLLKQKDNLEKLMSVLQDISKFNDISIAIIDDESDVASTDKTSEENGRKIANLIDEILMIGKLKSRYIAVTATPVDNIFQIESDSKRKIEYIVPLKVQDTYYGFEKFHDENLKKISIIDKFIDKNNKKVIEHFMDNVLDTIKNIKNDEKLTDDKITFLINNDVDTNTHNSDYKIVMNWIESKRKESELDSDTKNILDSLQVNVINSKSSGDFEWSTSKYQIYIGGVSLSRGITFNNLAGELILNYNELTSTSSTMTQRCRWFGYRDKIYKYMKIFMIEKLSNLYTRLRELEKDLFMFLENGKKLDNECKIKIKGMLKSWGIEK
jgi:hypothetical protein